MTERSDYATPARRVARYAGIGLFTVASMVLCSCSGQATVDGAVRGAERDRPEQRFVALQQKCRDASLFQYADRGVWSNYQPSGELLIQMQQIATLGNVVEAIAVELRRVEPLARSQCEFNLLFPVLDLLLWAELASGLSTAHQRAKWWATWKTKFPLEMVVWGSAGLTHYENEILLSPLSYTNH